MWVERRPTTGAKELVAVLALLYTPRVNRAVALRAMTHPASEEIQVAHNTTSSRAVVSVEFLWMLWALFTVGVHCTKSQGTDRQLLHRLDQPDEDDNAHETKYETASLIQNDVRFYVD